MSTRSSSEFTDQGEVTYAGSERGEIAVGLPALRLLLADLFSRGERYSWSCDSVHVTACAAGFAVLADATLFVDPWPSRATRPDARERSRIASAASSRCPTTSWRWRVCHGTEPTPPAGSSSPAAP